MTAGYLSCSLSSLPGLGGMPNLCPASSSKISAPADACSNLASASAFNQFSAKTSVRRAFCAGTFGGGIEESVLSDRVVVSSASPLLATGNAIRRSVHCSEGRDRTHKLRQMPQGLSFEAIVITDATGSPPARQVSQWRAPELGPMRCTAASKIIWGPSRAGLIRRGVHKPNLCRDRVVYASLPRERINPFAGFFPQTFPGLVRNPTVRIVNGSPKRGKQLMMPPSNASVDLGM